MKRKTNTTTAQVVVGLALVSALITFLTLTGYTPILPTHNVVLSFFGINAALILILTIMIIKEIWELYLAKRKGSIASKLHIRIVWLFAFIASAPVILIAIAASITLDRGVNTLLSNTVQTTISSSVNVANAYVDEQVQRIRIELSAMAKELDNARFFLYGDTTEFDKILTANTY